MLLKNMTVGRKKNQFFTIFIFISEIRRITIQLSKIHIFGIFDTMYGSQGINN